MSSFIISKVNFVKAAGLMYGIEETKRDKHEYFMEHCRERFERCYLLNVASVNEQYGDSTLPEEGSYDAEFETFRDLGRRIYGGSDRRMNRQQLRPRLLKFFGSVLYQIENDAAHRAVAEWFFICTEKLFGPEIHAVDDWWGDVDLLEDLNNL